MNTTTSTNVHTVGYLELIIGPMFSGKTSKLLELYKQCTFCNIPVSIVNHSLDKRYDNALLSSHDKVMAPCLQCTELNELWSIDGNNNENETWSIDGNNNETDSVLHKSHVILINEGQFFPDLYDVVVDMLNQNKKVYISGLDGDFTRKRFGSILDLIPLCDKVTKLTSLCSFCRDGTPGIFSMRLTPEKEQTVVGVNNYMPVCRKCYDTKNMSK
jgi:thymidine kinase